MEYVFSDKIRDMKPSAIREILKNASSPDVIPLSAGNPASEAFPCDAVARITASLLERDPVGCLQYGITEGYTPLRDCLKDYMTSRNSFSKGDDLIVTCGAQQVMELAVKVLCNEGDTIISESPSFIGSLNAFRSLGARIAGVDMTPDGMDTDMLEEVIRNSENPRFVYVIPNFQNPSGYVTSLEKRHRIYELAQKFDLIIVEDDPYGELYFDDFQLPTLKSMDTDGRVIYAGSFSKTLSPGLRVGWCAAGGELIKKLTVAKQVEDVHTNLLAQRICHEFMTEYDYPSHLAALRSLYAKKAAAADEFMRRYLTGTGISWQAPRGGLFIWCMLPDGVDMPAFCAHAIKKYKTAVVPGTAFLTDEAAATQAFRVNFSTPSIDQLESGIAALADALHDLTA